MSNTKIFNGRQSLSLEEFAEIVTTGSVTAPEARKLYATVAWFYRCVDIRAGAIANLPWELLNAGNGDVITTSDDDMLPGGLQWLSNLNDMTGLVEAAAVLRGKAYVNREMVPVLPLTWLAPDTITPVWDKTTGELLFFERKLPQRLEPVRLEIDEVVYFWPPDPFVERGPAKDFPGKAAMAAAGVLRGLDEFLLGYLQRGLVKATMLTFQEAVTPDEAARTKEWWRRIFTGVSAWASEVVRGDFKPIVIGEGISDLGDHELTDKEREAICTALGVPQSKVSTKAGGMTDSTGSDNIDFIQDTVTPRAKQIARAFNGQLLNGLGLHLRYTPQKLPIMQEDEEQRSGAVLNLVNAGMPLVVALSTLGYTIPDDQMAQITVIPQSPPPPAPGDMARADEIRRFRRWLAKRENPDVTQYKSDVLTHADKVALAEVAVASTPPFGHTSPGVNSESETTKSIPF